jgi:NitT/TauT family transport system permease protein
MVRMKRHAPHRYPVSLRERVYTIVVGPLALVAVLFALLALLPHPPLAETHVSIPTLLLATLFTLARLALAYALSVVIAIPVALLIERNRAFETVLLPLFDVLESVPNLALLPFLVVLFSSFGFLEGAAIVILILNMVWSIAFAVVGGLQVIQRDVTSAARMFGLSGFGYVRRLVLPAIFPQFVTGSILAVASGWNIIIVAEALHAYLPGGTASQDLFGIGSILVFASEQGDSILYLFAFSIMIAAIALFNFFVWQRLLHFVQRFRFE